MSGFLFFERFGWVFFGEVCALYFDSSLAFPHSFLFHYALKILFHGKFTKWVTQSIMGWFIYFSFSRSFSLHMHRLCDEVMTKQQILCYMGGFFAELRGSFTKMMMRKEKNWKLRSLMQKVRIGGNTLKDWAASFLQVRL